MIACPPFWKVFLLSLKAIHQNCLHQESAGMHSEFCSGQTRSFSRVNQGLVTVNSDFTLPKLRSPFLGGFAAVSVILYVVKIFNKALIMIAALPREEQGDRHLFHPYFLRESC